LSSAEAFYAHALGFEVVTRHYPGALFLATGGYHHHIGLNIWGERHGRVRSDIAGLSELVLRAPDAGDLAAISDRLQQGGYDMKRGATHVSTQDSDGGFVRIEA